MTDRRPTDTPQNEVEALYPYVQRIRRATLYTGSDDYEDVVSILRELLADEHMRRIQTELILGNDERDKS